MIIEEQITFQTRRYKRQLEELRELIDMQLRDIDKPGFEPVKAILSHCQATSQLAIELQLLCYLALHEVTSED